MIMQVIIKVSLQNFRGVRVHQKIKNCIGNHEEKRYFNSLKIWSVSTRLSDYLFAVRHLNKLETANISIYKQSKSKR